MDPATAEHLNTLIDKVNGLSTGGVIIVGLLVIAYASHKILATWINHASKRAEGLEKGKRANTYASAIRELAESLERHSSREDKMSREQSALLRSLVTLSSGYLSREDSLQVIKDAYLKWIMKDFQRIAETSIYRNHWLTESVNIELRVTAAFDQVISEVIAGIRASYAVSLKLEPCFPLDNNGHFALSNQCWAVVANMHKARSELKAVREGRRSGETHLHAENVYLRIKTVIENEYKLIEHAVSDVSEHGQSRFIKSDFLQKGEQT